MTRRDVNWLVASAAATIAGETFLSSWLASGHEMHDSAPPEPDRWTKYQPRFFSPQQYSLVEKFTTLLIPTDETPGAREAHLAPFIDFIVFSSHEYAPEIQAEWTEALGYLQNNNFDEKLMAEMARPSHPGHRYFQMMKQLSAYGFYTSRAGLIDNLEYKGVSYNLSFPGCSHPEHQNL